MTPEKTPFYVGERLKERRKEIFGTLAGFAIVTSAAVGLAVIPNAQAEAPAPIAYNAETAEEYQEIIETLALENQNSNGSECANNNTVIRPFEADYYTGPQEIEPAIEHIQASYGIEVSFLDTEYQVQDSHSIEPSKFDAVGKRVNVLELLDVLQRFDPAMIQAAQIEKVVFSGEIHTTDNTKEVYAGLYSSSDNAIFLYSDNYKTKLHEIAHAIDYRIFCAESPDFSQDVTYSDFNEEEPYGDTIDKELADSSYAEVMFASNYAATSVVEDRAETISRALYTELILPGDDTWGSPLQKKQEEMLVRYEVASPGFMAHFFEHN